MPLPPFFKNGFVKPHKAATMISQMLSTVDKPTQQNITQK